MLNKHQKNHTRSSTPLQEEPSNQGFINLNNNNNNQKNNNKNPKTNKQKRWVNPSRKLLVPCIQEACGADAASAGN